MIPKGTAPFPGGLPELPDSNDQRCAFEDERRSQDDIADQVRPVTLRLASYLRYTLIEREDGAGDEETNGDDEGPEEPFLSVAERVLRIWSSLGKR
jgi:hypothetical protein